MSWCGRLQKEVDILLQAPKDYTEKGEMDGGTGMSSVPGARKMPYILARSGQWPVPGTSTTGDTGGSGLRQKESTDYDQTVSERVYGKHSLFWPRSICGSAAVTSWNSLPSTEPKGRNRGVERGEEKAQIRIHYEVGHYLG